MNAEELSKILVEREGYPDNGTTLATARRLLGFGGKAAEMLSRWIKDGEKPEFEAIEGVDSNFLRSRLDMKDPAVIISYAMLEADPKENAEYLKHLATDRIIFRPQISKE